MLIAFGSNPLTHLFHLMGNAQLGSQIKHFLLFGLIAKLLVGATHVQV